MSQKHINLGTPGGKDGGLVRDEFSKVEDNFSELYPLTGNTITNISVSGTTTKTITLNKGDGTTLQADFIDIVGSGDTTYDDTIIQAEVDLNTLKETNIAHPLVETAVPVGALFTDTDTVYDDTTIQTEVDLNTLKETNIAHPLVETAVPSGAVFTDTIYDDTAIQAEVDLNTLKATNVDHPLVETAVPSGAVFTDTIYDDTALSNAVALNTLKETNIVHPLVETAVPSGAVFTDTDTVYDDTIIQAEVDLNTVKTGITITQATNIITNTTKISATSEVIYNTESRLIDLSAGDDIDVSLGEDFTKVCGTDQTFTISNPILRKPIRLELTGGNLLATLFTGYNINWIGGSSLSDYIGAETNYLYCEVRSVGEIYSFFEI